MGDNPATFRYIFRVVMNGVKRKEVGPFPAWGFKPHVDGPTSVLIAQGVKALQGKGIGSKTTLRDVNLNGNRYVYSLERATDNDSETLD